MIDLIKEYIEKRIELIKLDATEKTLKIIGISVPFFIILVFFFFFFILLNIGLALLIGMALENYAYGSLILSGCYFLMIVIVFLFRNSIKNLIVNQSIKSIFKE